MSWLCKDLGEKQMQKPWGRNELDMLKTQVEREERSRRRRQMGAGSRSAVVAWVKGLQVTGGSGRVWSRGCLDLIYMVSLLISWDGSDELPTFIPLSVSLQSPGQRAQLKTKQNKNPTSFPASLKALHGQYTKFWPMKWKHFAPPFFSFQLDMMTRSPAAIFNHKMTLG